EANRETLACESQFLWLLVQLIERYGNQQPRHLLVGREDRAIARACDYLATHFTEGVSLTELAAETNLSRYHLLRTFRNTIGMPPHAYQESLRIRHAQKLLANATPLAEVAYAVGYSSQAHFTQRFKQIIGVTPGKYVQ
ncbi:MAG: helix-turn-helix transcriptional regulator, partial [Caldilineaceae bacterium]|nr:helix-turn-helix transcriptional regulator [Caldilineaceae bacterium]